MDRNRNAAVDVMFLTCKLVGTPAATVLLSGADLQMLRTGAAGLPDQITKCWMTRPTSQLPAFRHRNRSCFQAAKKGHIATFPGTSGCRPALHDTSPSTDPTHLLGISLVSAFGSYALTVSHCGDL